MRILILRKLYQDPPEAGSLNFLFSFICLLLFDIHIFLETDVLPQYCLIQLDVIAVSIFNIQSSFTVKNPRVRLVVIGHMTTLCVDTAEFECGYRKL